MFGARCGCAEVVPHLWNMYRRVHPGVQLIPGAAYYHPDGRWLWVSRDAPLMTLGANATLSRRQTPPRDPYRLLAMIFNNFWYTNFVADEHGIMEFQFDLVWWPTAEVPPHTLADALMVDPIVLINPGVREDPRLGRHLYHP